MFAQRIEFTGSRRLKLVGHLTHADSRRGVVLGPGLPCGPDRDAAFGPVASALRRAGWGSLAFDFSGSGESDDNVPTVQAALDDLQHAVALMRSLGYRQLALWGQGLGARLCLDAPVEVMALVLSEVQAGWRPDTARRGWQLPPATSRLLPPATSGLLTPATSRLLTPAPGWPRAGPPARPREPGAGARPSAAHATGRDRPLAPALRQYLEHFDTARRTQALRCPALALLPAAEAGLPCRWPGLRALLPPGRDSAALGPLQLQAMDDAEELVLHAVRWLGQQGSAAPR